MNKKILNKINDVLVGGMALITVCVTPVLGVPVSWDGGGDGFSWDDPLNWDIDDLPGALDDVVIDITGETVDVVHASGDTVINSLQCAENFELSGGSVTVTDASSIDGELEMGVNTALTADGSQAQWIANGIANCHGASFYALNGGSITITNLSSFLHAALASHESRVFRADGTGSRLSFPNLVSILNDPSGSAGYNADIMIEALNGGIVDMVNLESIVEEIRETVGFEILFFWRMDRVRN